METFLFISGIITIASVVGFFIYGIFTPWVKLPVSNKSTFKKTHVTNSEPINKGYVRSSRPMIDKMPTYTKRDVKIKESIDDDYTQGMFYFHTKEYHAAAEFFARAYRGGHERKDSLYYHGKCKFLEATFQLNNFDDITRKTAIISGISALEDVIKQFGVDNYTIAELCCAEYALGLLHKPSNGRTSKYNEYLNQLKTIDPNQLPDLEAFLPTLEREYL